jgi:carboxymethylenebutenolidase
MQEETAVVATSAGRMEAFITRPEGAGPFHAVIVYMDVWGVREELFDIARKVATVGYACLVPDFLYREGRIRHAYYDDKGRMRTLESLNEEQKLAVRTPARKLTDEMVIDDTRAILGHLAGDRAIHPGAMGTIGYCMGGRHVFRVAGAFPERLKANVCLHGSDLVREAGDSPHLSAARAAGELYGGYAEHDRFAAAAVRAAVALAMKTSTTTYREVLHAGAHHGYALPDRDVYDKRAANRDWEVIFPMLRRQLTN